MGAAPAEGAVDCSTVLLSIEQPASASATTAPSPMIFMRGSSLSPPMRGAAARFPTSAAQAQKSTSASAAEAADGPSVPTRWRADEADQRRRLRLAAAFG